MYAVWHHTPIPATARYRDAVLIRVDALPGGPPRIAVRLLHQEHGAWRLAGSWPSLGHDRPVVIAPTVQLVLSAHRRLLPHAAPLPSLHPDDPDPDPDE